jgi:pyridoxamine 5'-phosphate oxidase-like protein
MTSRLPADARRVLEEGEFCHLAARTQAGPHLTPLVYVLERGRIWVTTSRRSVKARVWRRDPTVAGLVRSGDMAVAFRGRVRTYDALDPLSWPAAAARGPTIATAAVRFSVRNARFFAGYAVDARRVPLAWTPPGRVFAAVEIAAGVVLDLRTGQPVNAWGEWPPSEGGACRASFRPADDDVVSAITRGVPSPVLRELRSLREATVAIQGTGGLTVVPAVRKPGPREGFGEYAIGRGSWDRAAAGLGSPAAVTLHRASTWRASEMLGIMVQGSVEPFARPETARGVRALEDRLLELGARSGRDAVLVRVRPRRTVWWHGWTSGTVTPRMIAGSR